MFQQHNFILLICLHRLDTVLTLLVVPLFE